LRSLAWTIDEKTAEWFANRWGTVGEPVYVARAEIAKAHVLAYLDHRNEAEIVLFPKNLRNFTTRHFAAVEKISPYDWKERRHEHQL
jgi:hypothetical protein